MSNFKRGDRVIILRSAYPSVPFGTKGYVKGYINGFIEVCLNKKNEVCLPFKPDEISLDVKEATLNQPQSKTGAMREKLNIIPYDLVPFQEITDAYSRVAEFGAKKYDAWNWSKGLGRVQIICSLLRHTFAYLRGEDKDKDSGLSHTDHILWNAVTLSHSVHWNINDDRRVEPEREYKNEKI